MGREGKGNIHSHTVSNDFIKRVYYIHVYYLYIYIYYYGLDKTLLSKSEEKVFSIEATFSSVFLSHFLSRRV